MIKHVSNRSPKSSRGRRRWARFSLRGTFGFVTVVACLAGFFEAFVRPAADESRFLFQLRAEGAQVTAVSIVPPLLSKYVNRRKFQHATKIDLNTPQATTVFMKENRAYPKLRELTLVGASVDAAAIRTIARRIKLTRLTLDSTGVTAAQLSTVRKLHPNVEITRTPRWQHAQIDRMPQWPSFELNDPATMIQLVNHLRVIGKENAIETLDWYVLKHGIRQGQTMQFLVPLVFEPSEVGAKLPVSGSRRRHRRFHSTERIIREATSMNDLLDELESWDKHWTDLDWYEDENAYYLDADAWPALEMICFAGGIPFDVQEHTSGGYSLPPPASSRYLLRWAKERANVIGQPMRPIDDPHLAVTALVEHLERYSEIRPEVIMRLRDQLRDDAQRMLRGISGPARWNDEMQRYESAGK